MSDPVTLASGFTVALKPHYTHRMEVAFKEALGQGVTLRQEGNAVVVGEIKADVMDRVAEAVLPLLIESITKDTQPVPFSREWLLDLPEDDFALLRDKVVELRGASETRQAAGKKNR